MPDKNYDIYIKLGRSYTYLNVWARNEKDAELQAKRLGYQVINVERVN